jgi:ribosomal protein S18 acetylase RimI-like enzyme
MDVTYRPATGADTESIARLHADSWRRTYRGMYSDAYLDGDLVGDRLAVWKARMDEDNPRRMVILAESGGALAGFVCVVAEDDPAWGSLIDNLHVSYEHQRHGLGRDLMRAAADCLEESFAARPVYLWALEGNTNARKFYEGLRGRLNGTETHDPPGAGTILACRYVWDSPSALAAACDARS